MKDWIRDATASGSEEADRLNPMLPASVREGIVYDTASTDEEAQALYRRLRNDSRVELRRSRPLLPLLLGGGVLLAATAAAATTAIVVGPALLAPTEASVVALQLQAGESHAINPAIEVSGLGDLSVDQADDRHAEVTLDRGLARFDVAATGADPQLVVHAADVDVTMNDATVTVRRLGDDVGVDADRGEAAVSWGASEVRVQAGQSWRRGEGVAEAAPSDTIDAEADAPEPDVADDGTADEPAAAEPTPADVGADAARSWTPAAGGASAPSPIEPVVATTEVDPCDADAFSPQCARSRATRAARSPELRFAALQRAMARVGQDPDRDREIVQDCDTFLTQHGQTPWADDVRAFRVEAAFHGARASTVVRVADAYLAAAAADHVQRAQVQRWRDIANLRMTTLDMAQRDECHDALPMLRDLASLESGVREQEALAWRGICAAKTGAGEEARNVLRQVREEDLAPALRQRVRDAWLLVP